MLLPTLTALLLSQAPPPLTSTSEQSGWKRTGRYAEAEGLCRAFPKAFPGKARCDTLGTSPEGRPLVALVVSQDGTLTADAARRKQRPVVFFQGGIHAGEIDGKDAGYWLLRDALQGKVLPGALKGVTAVFVPVFNLDGHERFGPNHRPNQVGPEEMGFRTTAQNLNLNRDYAKVDAPEMALLLKYLAAWDPLVYVDLHVTDGAKFEPDVSVAIEPQKSGPPALMALGLKLREELFTGLTAQGHQPLPFYPSFVVDDDPSSGFTYGVPPPRFSHGYWAIHHRFGVLVETHAWKTHAQRVKATRDVMEGLLRLVARDGAVLQAAVKAEDQKATSGEVREVVLAWENTSKRETLPFKGYVYTRAPSDISGQTWIRYDDTKPQTWNVPYAPDLQPALRVTLPTGGYVVSAAHAAWVAPRLTTHGIAFQRLTRAVPTAPVESFHSRDLQFRVQSIEGRQGLTAKGAWKPDTQGLPAGSLYVPVAQKNVQLVAHLFEPSGPDSFLAWGFFNAHFEQKEYIEDYVVEPYARELLAKDPTVKAAFQERLKDPAFAKDPHARLRFFAERHPAWDERFGLYPVYRVASAPEGLAPAK
ncbi:M14 family zinc carboxypeptidase [Corallococcus sicarius]|uniref:Peptidase M14 n=1 Tax=Corallococcus sicarius TaxID=2316726 RepID=A0A3A8MYE5_9BACT|nr:M14 family zinc carboxypeptidase [Corallococcus sicarius]RKH36319.1 peptidase M14 [Corallococcus sicarius]